MNLHEPQAAALPDDEQDVRELRSSLYSTLADVEALATRRLDNLERRMGSLEKRASILAMPEEMKTFLVMMGISVAAAVVVPLLQGLIEGWRDRWQHSG